MAKKNKTTACLIVLMSLILLSAAAFGQSTAASLGGTVMDASRAVLPGTEITAVNEDTGVSTKVTANNSGVYNFASLQPGTYRVTAEIAGFQRSIRQNVRLGSGSQLRLDFDLTVAGFTTEVEVTATVENMILESGSSTGTVLQQDMVTELPLVVNDTLELINVMGGVVRSEDPATWADRQSFAGVSGNNINISRDGISVNEIRYNSGIQSPARLNPELVGEFKMILSPVDAEMGRGAGQVQMTTRSGSNTFHGSGVWNIQNTALDAYDYNDKHFTDSRYITPKPWRNLHNYTLTASGPIVMNKTFFFVSWDQAISKGRESYNATVLTPCARKGIYRYISGVRGVNATTDPSVVNGSTPSRPVVDAEGKPLINYTFPVDERVYGIFSGKDDSFGGRLRQLEFQSVFGELSQTARAQILADPINCSQYTPHEGGAVPTRADFGVIGNWDDFRIGYDQSGFVSRFSALMPPAFNYDIGDGLNTAGHRWTRRNKGVATIFGGNIFDDNRKAITVKIDHNINDAHRVSGTYSYESNIGDDGQRMWPSEYGGFGSIIKRNPQTFTASLTSTLGPTLINELRVGMSRTQSMTFDPFENPENEGGLTSLMADLLQGTDFPYYDSNLSMVAGPGIGNMLFHPDTGLNSQPYGSRRTNLSTTWGGVDPRWTFADAVTWLKGAHSFKAGIEYRTQQSRQEANGYVSMANGADTYPSIRGGVLENQSPYRTRGFSGSAVYAPGYDPVTDPNNPQIGWRNMPAADTDYTQGGAAMQGNYLTAHNLLTYMSGSVGTVAQYFFAVDAMNPRWNDVRAGENFKISDLRNREISFFFKDDWKFNNSLTFNIGVRYEYYGVPWEGQGLAAGTLDGFAAAMGMSGGSDLSNWMPTYDELKATGNNGDTGFRTRQAFVGKNSPNEDVPVFNKDMNNFAPHVGFSWQLPWFGVGQTTLRGGYSISYTKVGNYDNTFGYSSVMANQPGAAYAYLYGFNNTSSTGCVTPGEPCYLDFNTFGKLLPLYDPARGGFFLMDEAVRPEPLGMQDPQRRSLALHMYDPDIRSPYIQNLNVSLTRQIGRNLTVDVRYVGTLTRKGLSSTSTGLNINTPNLVNSGLMNELITVRAGGQSAMLNELIGDDGYLYRSSPTDDTYRTGSDQIRSMWGQNIANGNFVAVVQALATSNGNSYSRSAAEAPAGTLGYVLRRTGTPENLIYANPQYSAVNVRRNQELANYHSMQAQVTLQPTHGLNFQATYTWSRNLTSRTGDAVTDYNDWGGDYWLSRAHRSHQLNINGMWTLPFGPNGFLLRNATGALKKAVEGWQIGWIASAVSGVPMSLAGNNTLWANGTVDIVGPFDTKSGYVEWDDELNDGFFYGKDYVRVVDPQCFDDRVVGSSMRGTCAGTSGLKALMRQNDGGPDIGYRTLADYNNQQNGVPGTIIFQNAKPGERGNFGRQNLTGPGRLTLDANIGKSIEFMEGKRLEIRVDAQNILNHATPSLASSTIGARGNMISDPFTTINTSSGNTFGLLSTKTGHRTFQGKIRISF